MPSCEVILSTSNRDVPDCNHLPCRYWLIHEHIRLADCSVSDLCLGYILPHRTERTFGRVERHLVQWGLCMELGPTAHSPIESL